MPAPRTFKGQRANFLESKGPEYAKARVNGTAKDVVAVIQRQFFARWPVDLPLDVERPQGELDAVNDDEPLPERPNPDATKDAMSEDEYTKAVVAYKKYQKDLATRKRQIESRLKDDFDKAHATNMKGSDKQYLSDLLVDLSYGTKGKGKHRKDSAAQAWLAQNGVEFRKIYEERKAKEKPGKNFVPDFHNRCLRDVFGKLPKQEQEEWEKKAKEDHKRELAEWKEKRNGKPSETPEDRQACIDRLGLFCKPILDGICARTGWVATVILGGPEPRDGGRLNMIAYVFGSFCYRYLLIDVLSSIHGGTPAKGPIQIDWGRSEINVWKEHVFPSMGRHLRKVYSVEECRSRAMTANYGGGERNEEGSEVMRWREGDGLVSKAEGDKAKEGGGNQDQAGPSGQMVDVDTSNTSSGQKSSKKSHRKKVSTSSRASSQSAESSDDDNEDDLEVTRSSPPRTRNAVRQEKSKSAPSTPSPRNGSVVPSPGAGSPIISLPASPTRVDSPYPSPLPQFMGTSPSSQSYRTSPDPRTSPDHVIEREATPSPAPHRSPSPLSTPVRSSAKRTAVESEKRTREPKRSRTQEKETATVPKAGKKRKSSDDGRQPEQASGESSKKRRLIQTEQDEEEQGDGFPELPEGAGNGKDFYASQALALFRLEEVTTKEGWVPLVRKWMEFEVRSGFEGTKKLSTTSRPPWVTEWIQRGRSPSYLKPKHNVYKHMEKWWSWWEELQPQWRGFNDRKRPDLPEDYPDSGSWEDLRVGGSNGLTSVLAALAYAAVLLSQLPKSATGREKEQQKDAMKGWDEAVDDVGYVLQCLLESP
ncbi:SERTA domain-containing protein 3 [Marasmius crinis-equi]|uniref:SERTA domain-containing protein 3 n=1 Tax=Marasmius crinis-equi TaxID=585013 RepID=A0ABR3ER67_9AGAR